MEPKKLRRALVIEGGGADGLLAVGAVQYLVRRGYTFDAMFGTSIGGAIILALAYYYTQTRDWNTAADRLEEQFSTLSMWDLIKAPNFGFLWSGGYFIANMQATFKKLIGSCKVSELALPVAVAVTDVDVSPELASRTLGNIFLKYDYKIEDLAAMTTNIPVVYKYFKDPATGHRICDGGICANNAVAAACEYLGSDAEIIVIRLSSWTPSSGWFDSPLSNAVNLFALARAKCELYAMKISKLYSRIAALEGKVLNVKTLEFKESVGLINFNPASNGTHIRRGFNFCRSQWSETPDGRVVTSETDA